MCSAIVVHGFRRVLFAEREEKIEIADGFLAAAQRARRRDGFDLRAKFHDVSGKFLRRLVGVIQFEAAGGFLEGFGGAQNVLLALFAEAFEQPKLSIFRELLYGFHSSGLERFPKHGNFFRADGLELQQIENCRGIFLEAASGAWQ